MVARLEQDTFPAMGTACAAAVTAPAGESRRARTALAAARAEVEACERALSRFDPGSDLSRLNAAGGAWTPVGERLLAALQAALRARLDSGGRFDPTVLPALVAAGYDRTFAELEQREPRPARSWRAGAAIELDRERGAARLEPGAAVDLGGIGKGFGAARALDAMREAWPGLPGALVDLGGDIAVEGAPPGDGPWRIAVAEPRRPGATLGTIALRAGGVATSGRDRRRFGPGRALHHLIDPATGLPAARGPLAVTVVAPDAPQAEAFATALAVCSLDEGRALLARLPALAALRVPDEGEPETVNGFPWLRQPSPSAAAA
ncbi:MAG TPA: FAD:protein FMN transferase [Gaiellaceae bacterium]|nr:FAD:protein FMN transferase [Gaiellaceae bacterium]